MKRINSNLSEPKLADYAVKESGSRGREFKEDEQAPYRSIYQRDRDRIIHSAAFRRLEYKTQVFVNHEGDYYRTRLTHTLEVAQIARTIAKALYVNEELTEAIALAHDLGHTPFGHSGEEILNTLMKERGGFNHNVQSLRVVEQLEERYPHFKGLNLTWETREGIIKHSHTLIAFKVSERFKPNECPSLETQIVDKADEIAYDSHDIDDGIASGLFDTQSLRKIPICRMAELTVNKKYGALDANIRKYQIIRFLINSQVSDLIVESQRIITKHKIKTLKDVRASRIRLISFSAAMQRERLILRDFLSKNMYNHYRVVRMCNKAKRFVKELFNIYLDTPELLPPEYQNKIMKEGHHRVICDYIAGMTDRFALNEYRKLFDPYEKV